MDCPSWERVPLESGCSDHYVVALTSLLIECWWDFNRVWPRQCCRVLFCLFDFIAAVRFLLILARACLQHMGPQLLEGLDSAIRDKVLLWPHIISMEVVASCGSYLFQFTNQRMNLHLSSPTLHEKQPPTPTPDKKTPQNTTLMSMMLKRICQICSGVRNEWLRSTRAMGIQNTCTESCLSVLTWNTENPKPNRLIFFNYF